MAASPSLRICFNSECSELKSERTRKGWQLRTGDFAQLCDRCGSAYEEGRFCEKFHSKASGWRSCESCGKRVHCGCIVSVHAYMLLEAGGVECIACAKKNANLVANPVWPPSVSFHSSLPVRSKDISLKNWNYLAGSGPVPWHQAPTMFNASVSQPDLFKRMINEVDSPTGLDRHNLSDRLSALSFEKNKIETYPNRFMNGMLKLGSQDIFENGNTGMVNLEHARSNLSNCQRPQKDDAANSHSAIPSVSSTEEKNGHMGALGTSIRPSPQPLPVKPYHDNQQNGPESSGDTQMPSGKPRCDAPGQSLGFPRYWPRFTDQDLQQASADSNSVITPLFEKMLSASDAGKIGRLVLPKKCAEVSPPVPNQAYFPPISQPEGLPLQVQDSKGNEWKFQFRFWPNNNSRMYVLEGVTPCIQSMQLQAGDVVTFSRVEPGGKLLMGFRKSSIASASDQDHEVKCSNGVSTDVAELADPTSCSKVDKSGYSAKDAIDMKPSISRKRKSSVSGPKIKRLKVDNEDLIELKVTWEEAQVLLRPPPNHISSIVVIEGFEFEEYEDAPVIGKPTIFATDNEGKKVQWAQCEECFKWRKLPANAFLPSRWTCFGNSWDPDRSFCLAAQELTAKQLDDLLACRDSDSSKKMKAAKMRKDDIDSLEGLDTLANLAIFGESEGADEVPSSQVTTKHPRHRPGCSCIVCIQPPSKGPKHKPTCTCNVCLMVKRRFCTLASRREKKQPQKEPEVSQEKPETPLPDKLDGETISSNNAGSNSPDQNKAISEGSDGDPNKIKSSNSPFKGQIDLNIQPEREEELSPHRGRVIDLESYHWSPPVMPVSGETSTLAINQSQVRVKEEEMNGSSTISIVSSYQDTKNSNIARFASTISGPKLAAGSCRERFIDVESLNCDPIDVETYWPRPFKPVFPGSSEISAQASNQRQVRIKEEENDGSTIPVVSSHRDAENGHTARFASIISGSTSAARSHWVRSTDVESWNWHPIDVESYKWSSSPFVPGLPSSSETYISGSNQRQIRITEEGNNGNTIATVSSTHQDAENGHMTQFASTVSGSTSAAG